MTEPTDLFRCLSCGALWRGAELNRVFDCHLGHYWVCGDVDCYGCVIMVHDELPLHPLIGRNEELNLWQSFRRRMGFVRVGYYRIEPDGFTQLVLFLHQNRHQAVKMPRQ
ncbi:MAG: hypothetical protein WCX71_02140 [Candidatus Buchananbacteria bacterium]